MKLKNKLIDNQNSNLLDYQFNHLLNLGSLFLRLGLILLCLVVLVSCTKKAEVPEQFKEEDNKFEVSDVFKNNLNYTIEISRKQTLALIADLTVKLYKRNPNQIKKELGYQVEDVLELIENNRVSNQNGEMIAQLGNYKNEELLKLSMHPRYKNDRVLAFVYGLQTMVISAYGGKDYYLFDQIEPQKIYQLARNFEIAFWRLFNTKTKDGKTMIESISLDAENQNLSYQRLAGQMIQIQDLLAEVTSKAYGKNLTKQWFDIPKAFYFII